MVTESQSEAREVQGIINNTLEVIAGSREIILADGSTSAPNFRASEPLFTAVYLSRFPQKIRTSLSEADVIARMVKGSPFQIITPIGRDLDRDYSLEQGVRTLELNPILIEQHYSFFFGNPLERVQSLYERAMKKVQNPETAYGKARRYVQALPATLFSLSLSSTITYVDQVMMDRSNLVNYISQGIFAVDRRNTEERISKMVGDITLRDVINQYKDVATVDDNLQKRVALVCACPECSLGSDIIDPKTEDSIIRHAVSFDGLFFRNTGALTARESTELHCMPMKSFKKYLESNRLSILDIPLRVLILAGFKPSGKLQYLAESLVNQETTTALAIRDYSNPRGTIKMAFQLCKGFPYLTPRISVTKVNGDGNDRDATGYELFSFMSRRSGIALVTEFANIIPSVSDGRSYQLDIVRERIIIT